MPKKVMGRSVRRKKNSSEAATARLATDEEKKQAKFKEVIGRRAKYRSVADQIAEHKMHYRNHYYPGNEMFMDTPELRFVDRYYPYAKDGPLYVDEPRDIQGESLCETKRKHMKQKGLRYIVIKARMEMHEVYEQLG